jgi:hypothetical protein
VSKRDAGLIRVRIAGSGVLQRSLSALAELEFANRRHLAVPEVKNHIENLGPGREWAAVDPFVLVHRLEELELFLVHVAFFGGPAVIGSASTGTAATVELRTAFGLAASVGAASAFRLGWCGGGPTLPLDWLLGVGARFLHAPPLVQPPVRPEAEAR